MDKIIYSSKHSKEVLGEVIPEEYVFDMQLSTESMKRGLYIEEIAERRKKAPEFLEYAKGFCKEYEYDLAIHEVSHGFVLEVSLDIGQYVDSRLNRLIGMTDDIDIASGVNDRDLTFYLRYNIMAIHYSDGERIFPGLLGH